MKKLIKKIKINENTSLLNLRFITIILTILFFWPSNIQAFLFHQLQPATLSSLQSHQANFTHIENLPQNTYETNVQYMPISQINRQQQQVNSFDGQQQNVNYYTHRDRPSREIINGEPTTNIEVPCPSQCHCNKIAQIADCSNRNLIKVPTAFPQDIKRIRLERNNITELGPYSFKGLKRLQRIDLSNNNLQRIDSLAFAGGLQSLNSLILYSNKLSQLPDKLFNELNQLQLLLLNANSLQCINKALFQPLTNLNLLSLYDNNIETLVNGTFDGQKNIKTIHLGKNPLICDCNLRWLADYLESNPVETSEARCESPGPNQGKKLSQLGKQKFKCEGKESSLTGQLIAQCNYQQQQQPPSPPNESAHHQQQSTKGSALQPAAASQTASSCPIGCTCQGSTVDCSNATQSQAAESRAASSAIYELPDMPEDVPVYVTRVRINDSRIKRIRQTGLFRQLANSQKLDLGNNKIIDIEDNAINQPTSGTMNQKPERVVFVLMEKDRCDQQQTPTNFKADEDACSTAPMVNPPNFDSPCYNGGSCIVGARPASIANYSCLCPPGFAGPLCEINIDDCVDHQCQNEATCVDGVNSYRCFCRDPTTSGEFCEQLNDATSSANSIAPIALPMVSQSFSTPHPSAPNGISNTLSSNSNNINPSLKNNWNNSVASEPETAGASQIDSILYSNNLKSSGARQQDHKTTSSTVAPASQILARSADHLTPDHHHPLSIDEPTNGPSQQSPPTGGVLSSITGNINIENNRNNKQETCRKITTRKFLEDGNGCQSVKSLKISECLGECSKDLYGASNGCCYPTKIKRRKVRMQCNDNASYVKVVDIIKKCSCSNKCNPVNLIGQDFAINNHRRGPTNQLMFVNQSSQSNGEDQYGFPITTIDAVDS